MDGGAWKATVHEVAKSQTWLSDFTFTFHFHALEKEMAAHSNVLVYRIPGTGEPGRLPSMGSYRVGHDWSDLAAATCIVRWIVSLVWMPVFGDFINLLLLSVPKRCKLLFSQEMFSLMNLNRWMVIKFGLLRTLKFWWYHRDWACISYHYMLKN